MTVNMDGDREDLYLNLNSLLKDICRFLETKSDNLCPADRKKADALIERSKKHLQVIAKISTGNHAKGYDLPLKPLQETSEISNSNATERYVDMSKKPALPQRTIIVEPPLTESKCPFQGLPAKEASQEIKYGSLSKRRRVFNIIDLSTKVYASIHDNWLLVYGSNKDPKPDYALDLAEYEAKEDETDPNLTQVEITRDDSNKKNTFNLKMASSFKVFHSSPAEKKCYSFVATTHKDMLQWVVNINRRHDKAVSATKHIKDEQNYEICQDLQGSDDEENIYNEIDMPCRLLQSPPLAPKIPENDDRPAVPKKQAVAPPPSSLSSSTESMASYQELEARVSVKKPSEKCSLNSFESSDEEEDQTYYELDTSTKDIQVNVKKDQEQNQDNFDVPPPPDDDDDDDKDLTYANSLTLQLNELPKEKSDITKAVNDLPASENKLPEPPKLKNIETETKPQLAEKIAPKPMTPKPKILSPKPWKPFRKNIPSKTTKSLEICKNKPIRESLKNSDTLESKSSLEVISGKEITNTEENSVSANNDSKTPNDIWSSKHQGSSIVRIIRNRWSTSQSSSCNLETFSRNSKIETFQASPTKESPPADFLRSTSRELRPFDSLIPESSKNDKNKDEKPMVLLKPTLEDEDSSKKNKKSPVVPTKPKKVAKKLAF